MDFTQIPTSQHTGPGAITVVNWTLMPDGESYMYLWAENWLVITDKQFPAEGFHSSEKWQIAAIAHGEIQVVIPGCQVKAFVRCAANPKPKACYSVGRNL